MWLALIVVIGVTLGRMIWVCAADVLAFGRENKPVTITVYESDTMDSITDKLYDAGLIRYKSLFQLLRRHLPRREENRPRHLRPEHPVRLSRAGQHDVRQLHP